MARNFYDVNLSEQYEDKKLALAHFKLALKNTREPINDLILNEKSETVSIIYENDYTVTVNIACDSAMAMLFDVMKEIMRRV